MSTDRIMAALRSLIREEFPKLGFLASYQYSIVGVHGSPPSVTVDCVPVDIAIGLPDLVGLAMQPGIGGFTSIPTAGLNCVVLFLNGNPTLPRIVGVDSLGVQPVARLGDQVTTFLPPTLPVVGTVSGNPFTGVITVANPVTGIITGGSGKVFSG